MKKLKRFTAITIVMIMMCMLLCSCDTLDYAKESHANWTNDKSTDSITLSSGDTYLKLDGKNKDKIVYNTYSFQNIYVTDKDVPVLLSEQYGSMLVISGDKNFIYGTIMNDEIVFADKHTPTNPINYYFFNANYETEEVYEDDKNPIYSDVVYCKEELFDDISKQINEDLTYTHYGYSYYDKKTNSFEFYNLSDTQAKLIDTILKDVTPKTDLNFPTSELYICNLDSLTEDNFFGETKCEVFASDDGKEYYLAKYKEPYSSYECYKVPKEHLEEIKNITKASAESQNIQFYDYSNY